MHPKNHPLLNRWNLGELLIQSPFWIFFYGTGLIFPLQMLTWVVYGLGWYIHPRLYPLPHTTLMDFYAESILWLKNESSFGKQHPKLGRITVYFITVAVLIGIPALFIYYFRFLAWLYLDEPVAQFKELWRLLHNARQ